MANRVGCPTRKSGGENLSHHCTYRATLLRFTKRLSIVFVHEHIQRFVIISIFALFTENTFFLVFDKAGKLEV